MIVINCFFFLLPLKRKIMFFALAAFAASAGAGRPTITATTPVSFGKRANVTIHWSGLDVCKKLKL